MMNNLFGEYIFFLRHKRKLLQKQIALTAGFDPSYLTSLERGRRAPPRGKTLEHLMKALEVSELERQGLMRAAALSRLAKTLQEEGADLPGATQLLRLAILMPEFKAEELASLITLAEGLAERRSPRIGDLAM